jgi:organic radical activating enzyme
VLGVEKIRITGGEPLLRKGVETLIEGLACLRTPEGKDVEIALTTNGSLLARQTRPLRDTGLRRVTVSLDDAVMPCAADDSSGSQARRDLCVSSDLFNADPASKAMIWPALGIN